MSTPTGSEAIRRAAVAIIEQGEAFLASPAGERYAEACPGIGGATIGQHFRHAIDHFAALLDAGEANSIVAYDQRRRGTEIETSAQAALAKLGDIKLQLGDLDEVAMEWPVRIRVMVSTDGQEVELDSTMVRELAFVTHHAVHHWAISRIATTAMGLDTDPAFGRAPSTLSHEAGG